MRCEEARAAMLAKEDVEPVRQHLESCRLCRSEQPMWTKLGSTLSSHSLWEEPPADLGDRILETVRGHSESGTAGRTVQPRRRRYTMAAAVAMTAVLALAGSYVFTRTVSADWEVTLDATEEVPGASAVVQGWSTARGTRMVLEIAGIEDAPSGSYYEIWMTAPDGRHISAGTFSGSGRVTAFAGVRRADYPRIWITLESAGDDLGPSRETYFDTA